MHHHHTGLNKVDTAMALEDDGDDSVKLAHKHSSNRYTHMPLHANARTHTRTHTHTCTHTQCRTHITELLCHSKSNNHYTPPPTLPPSNPHSVYLSFRHSNSLLMVAASAPMNSSRNPYRRTTSANTLSLIGSSPSYKTVVVEIVR